MTVVPPVPEYLLRLGARTMAGVVRVQIFDRAMTLAAQAFTSIFPVLILLGSVLGGGAGRELADAAGLPDTSRRVLDDAFGHGGFSTFGVLGGLIVLVSSTGLARALARAHAVVWEVRRAPSGPRASWRWLIAVLVLAGFMVGSRLLGWLTHRLPVPQMRARGGPGFGAPPEHAPDGVGVRPGRGRGRAARARRGRRPGRVRGAAHRLPLAGPGAAARHGQGDRLTDPGDRAPRTARKKERGNRRWRRSASGSRRTTTGSSG